MPGVNTGFTEAEVAAACESETFLRYTPSATAVNELAAAIFEIGINSILHMPNEQKEWDGLRDHSKQRHLRDALWMLGRLDHAGFKVDAADPSVCKPGESK